MADKISFRNTVKDKSGNITSSEKISVYTDSKIDSLLALKGDKSVVDTKANKADVYTKSEVDSALAKKQGTGSYATLDSTGKVPASQLPSYVDDVLEGYLHNSSFYRDSAFKTTYAKETGKIYVDLPTGRIYRFGGTTFAEISSSLALGETSETAYAGDKGKANRADINTLKSYFTNGKANSASKADNATKASEATHAVNADNATKATNDASGNAITSTYATKTEVSNVENAKADKCRWETDSDGNITITLF